MDDKEGTTSAPSPMGEPPPNPNPSPPLASMPPPATSLVSPTPHAPPPIPSPFTSTPLTPVHVPSPRIAVSATRLPSTDLIPHHSTSSVHTPAASHAGQSSATSAQPATQADIELIQALEALQVSVANEVPGSSRQQEDVLVLTTPYNLLMKIPDPEYGKQVTQEDARKDLRRAWSNSYFAVSEVKENLFVATFETHRAMLFVLQRQPWMLRRHNLLLEIYDITRDVARDVDSYQFNHLEVSVRIYGIPRVYRTVQRIKSVIQLLGQPSDYHRFNPACLNWEDLYVPVKVKINVTRPAIDKIFMDVSETDRILVFIHYEKLQRICTYCAAFFHNAQECGHRLAQLQEHTDDLEDEQTAFINYGEWMNQLENFDHLVLPMIRSQYARAAQATAVTPSPMLTNLRQAFAARQHHPSTPAVDRSTIRPASPRRTIPLPTLQIQADQTHPNNQPDTLMADTDRPIQGNQDPPHQSAHDVPHQTMVQLQPGDTRTQTDQQQEEVQLKQSTDTATQAITVHQSQQQPQYQQVTQFQHGGQSQEQPMQIEHQTDFLMNQSLQDQMMHQNLTQQYWQGVQHLSQQQSFQATMLQTQLAQIMDPNVVLGLSPTTHIAAQMQTRVQIAGTQGEQLVPPYQLDPGVFQGIHVGQDDPHMQLQGDPSGILGAPQNIQVFAPGTSYTTPEGHFAPLLPPQQPHISHILMSTATAAQ